MIATDAFEQVLVSRPQALWNWLEVHHQQPKSVWVVTYKKSVPDRYVSVADILDAVIAHGWVDGIRRKTESDQHGERTMQLISPRKAQHWSKTYKDRAHRLEEEGRMQEAGRAAIARSKADGMWTFLDDVDALISPQDLHEALAKHEGAAAFFEGMSVSAKRFTLRWIKLAKTPATRQKRLTETALRSARGEYVKGVRMG